MGGAGADAIDASSVFTPDETALGTSFPNPFNATTTIPFAVAAGQNQIVDVSLRIYNSRGQLVKPLLSFRKKTLSD